MFVQIIFKHPVKLLYYLVAHLIHYLLALMNSLLAKSVIKNRIFKI